MARQLVFEIYGNFQVTVGDLPARLLGLGCVEIYRDDSEDPGNFGTLLRWQPKGSEEKASLLRANHFPNLSEPELDLALGDGTKPVELWLTAKPNAKLTNVRLRCSGAALVQEYFLDTGVAAITIPVLASYEWRGATFASEVVFGDPTDSKAGASFTLRMALQTPRPQCSKNRKASFSFPFAARYDPRPDVTGQRVSMHFAGAGPETTPDNLVDLDSARTVGRKPLGEFGYSRGSGGGRDQYLYWPRGLTADPNQYWPSDLKAFVNDVLARVCTPHPRFADQVSLASPDIDQSPDGQIWNSIGFIPPKDPAKTDSAVTVVYRSALFAVKAAGDRSGDLLVEGDEADLHFLIRDPLTPTRWIDTQASTLLIDFEVAYPRVEDPWEIVADINKAAPKITFRLGYDGPIQEDPHVDGLAVSAETPNSADLLYNAVRGSRRARLDSENLEATEPQSFAPEIRPNPSAPLYRFGFTGSLVAAPTPSGWAGQVLQRNYWSGVDPRFSLWPDAPRQFIGPAGQPTSLKATLAFPGFSAANDPAFEISFGHAEGDPSYFGALSIAPSGTLKHNLPGRLGGLEMVIGGIREGSVGSWMFGSRVQSPNYPVGNAKIAASEQAFDLTLDVLAFVPRGGDVDDRSGRSRPILIDPDADKDLPPGSGEAPFFVRVTEQCSAGSNRRLVARLSATKSAPSDAKSYVLLSQEPFSIVRFTSRSPQNYRSEDGIELADYDTDTGLWQFKTSKDEYHYKFQSQVAGESMDRPGRLELYDADPDKIAAEASVRPYDPREDNATAPGLLRRRAVEFRLSPSSELWISPSDLEQNYNLPEWDTYQLFRSKGALGRGVPLKAFRGEFIYGMPVSIDPALESGPSRTARVAELDALVGTIISKATAALYAGPDLNARWARISSAIASRAERYEFWMRDPDSATRLAPARFRDGVAFALRDTAIYRSPFGDTGPEALSSTTPGFRFARHGLPGGAVWPFESINICKRLRSSPESTGGTIERLALAPTGGDADQRAEFVNGQIAIISETRGGFVQRHRVEVIGRISVLWHRAKHVVVYERTVSPSDQFTPLTDPGDPARLADRSRRPILRKVSEYIELLQPLRTYPDMSAAPASSTGFLRSVRFNSTKIKVDSAWSEDLGDYGWRIPLWDRLSAQQRPSVYPRPDIAFVTAAEGEEDDPLVAQECLDPDNLYFFTDAKQDTADTDLWPSRPGIDYANLPEPASGQQPGGAEAPGGSKAASVSRIPKGHHPYTWRLASVARKTMINAGYGQKPLYAGLEALTFMRSTRPPATDPTATLIANALVVTSSSTSAAPEMLSRSIADSKAALEATIQRDRTDTASAQAAAALLSSRLQTLVATAQAYSTALGSGPKALHQQLGVEGGTCKKIVDDFVSSIQQRKLLWLSQIQDWVAGARRLSPLPDYATLRSDALASARAAIAASLPDESVHIDRVGRAVQKAQDYAAELQTEISETLHRAIAKVEEIRATYDQQKPWSTARVEQYHQRVAEVRDGVVGDVTTAVAEVQTKLATGLTSSASKIADAVTSKVRQTVLGEKGVLSAIRTGESAASGLLLRLKDEVATDLSPRVDDLEAAVTKAKKADTGNKYTAALQTCLDGVAKLKKLLANTQTFLEGSAVQVEAAAADLKSGITQATATLEQFARDVKGALADISAAAQTIADDDLDGAKASILGTVDAVTNSTQDAIDYLADQARWADPLVARIEGQLKAVLAATKGLVDAAAVAAQDALTRIQGALDAIRAQTLPSNVASIVETVVIAPAFDAAFPKDAYTAICGDADEWQRAFDDLLTNIEQRLDHFDTLSGEQLAAARAAVEGACGTLEAGLDSVISSLASLATQAQNWAAPFIQGFANAAQTVDQLATLVTDFGHDWDTNRQAFEQSYQQASAYADRVYDAAGRLTSGGLAAAPSNVLRLFAAAASAPALPNLDFARERLGYYYGELNKYVDTTPVEAWFGRLGDELKAMGLSLPFNKIGDGIIPSDLSNLDIGRVFRNFGGLELRRLFDGLKLPAGAQDAIKVSHAFDPKLGRAWVQVDVDLPMPGRKALFTAGPFELDMVDTRLVGTLRLEASKDNDRVQQTGDAKVITTFDAVISGESMVALQNVTVSFVGGSGLKVDIDPKNIRLNPAFRFLQETLAKLFPDEAGGLKIVKQNGIPIGVEHEFSIPPISLMAGTSGVSNIQIQNNFSLVAYPDFLITNRFALSKPEMPFVFSIFIIGGTGYVSVDCSYRPFTKALTVTVDAAAGGSASLGFAFGPVSGSVYITLSIALRYRKTSGESGALTVSLVLLIAGNVDVAGIATVSIALLLRMAYHEDGAIDGVGTLSITLRISRFFKISVHEDVNYKLRGATSSTSAAQQRGLLLTTPNARAQALAAAKNMIATRG